jgi:diaminohydroxyphosphoribosylaminopyrimidine deaminase / 5-amino-6-(5-phosphoribosylamino)uracil reductase
VSDAADHGFMARALNLAARGLYTSEPNPRVGCVLVRDGSVVGEGWHRRAGGPHAERVALKEAGQAARGATAYVTLEPCCHHGKTPPCTDALLASGIARVVAAMVDPNPLVAGQGLALLRAAGVAVESEVMETQARALNPGFVKRMAQGLPYVRCKLAASLDGRTAMASGESRWITSEEARRDVQFLRARSSAILTGVGTLLADDPSLNVRLGPLDLPGLEPGEAVRQPLRVVVDSRLRTPATARMLSLPGSILIACADGPPEAVAALKSAGAGVHVCPDGAGGVDLESLLRHLAGREFSEVLIEAGPTLAGAFVGAGLVDELILYLAPHLMGDAAPGLFHLPGVRRMAERIPLTLTDTRAVGPDWRLTARLGWCAWGGVPANPASVSMVTDVKKTS